MNSKSLTYMTTIVVIGALIILALNVLPYLGFEANEKYLPYNDVKGMAIEHQNKLYTLNFDQQKELIGILNSSQPIEKSSVLPNGEKPDFEKIVIYRFNKPDIEIAPIAYQNGHLIFSAPAWNSKGYMIDNSQSSVKALSQQAYDIK